MRVHRLSCKRAVEIDHVQIFKACGSKRLGLRGRIEGEHGRTRRVAPLEPPPLAEPDALAVLQVDCGKQDHGFHFKKFEIRASPNRWLFSGWNCVPTAVSL